MIQKIIQWNDNDKTYTIKDDNNNYYVRDDGFRKSSTSYVIGDIAYHEGLPAGWYLECTTAGITGAGELVISGTVAPNTTTVSDGTVMWTVRQGASTKNLTAFTEGKLTAGAGTTAASILPTTNNGYFQLQAGASSTSSFFRLFGVNYPDSNAGKFQLRANDGTNVANLTGDPLGNLNWAGNDLAGSAIVAKSLGTNGYIKYASGLIIQWGYTTGFSPSETKAVTFPVSYSTTSRIAATVSTATNSTGAYVYVIEKGLSTVIFKVANDNAIQITWIAIGY